MKNPIEVASFYQGKKNGGVYLALEDVNNAVFKGMAIANTPFFNGTIIQTIDKAEVQKIDLQYTKVIHKEYINTAKDFLLIPEDKSLEEFLIPTQTTNEWIRKNQEAQQKKREEKIARKVQAKKMQEDEPIEGDLLSSPNNATYMLKPELHEFADNNLAYKQEDLSWWLENTNFNSKALIEVPLKVIVKSSEQTQKIASWDSGTEQLKFEICVVINNVTHDDYYKINKDMLYDAVKQGVLNLFTT